MTQLLTLNGAQRTSHDSPRPARGPDFDDRLKNLLDKDQWQAYEEWRDQQRKFAEDRQRQRWQERSGGGRPPQR